MNKKYLFLDIDGTLVNFDGKMPDSAFTALRKAQQNGHELVICTGRHLSLVYPWLREQIKFDGLILSGGAMVIRSDEAVYHNFIDSESLREIVGYFESNHIPFYFQTSESMVSREWCVKKSNKFFEGHGLDPKALEHFFGTTQIDENLIERTDVEKIIYYDAGKDIHVIQGEVGDKFHIVGYSFGNLGTINGEISLSGINKAKGIYEYLNFCGADIKDSIAFGDADNDIEMLEAVGISVAMGNATNGVKAVADFVTAPITEDGLYKAFEHFNLI